MAKLADYAPPEPPVAQHGFVSKPPAAIGDPFTATVPDFDEAHVFEVRYWPPRGATLPAVGDEVLIVIDDKAEPWVAAWWPAAGDDPEGGGPDTVTIFSLVVSSTTPLAKEASWVSAWVPATFWESAIVGAVFADQKGTLHIEQSADGVNVDVDTSYEIEANDGKGFEESRVAKYWRVRFVNGAVAQGAFRLAAEVRGS
jgi:hypothetical protein